jgi:arylsulfatase A
MTNFGHSRFSKSLTLIVLLACVSHRYVAAEQPTSDISKPNIIVIYTDDQGFGDLSCYNAKAKFNTPNIDQLAAAGIRFTNAHSSDTVCTPSRYGLLTGRYCWRTTKKTGVLGAESKCLVTDERLTLASMLKQQGYQTGMVGKWHLGMDFPGVLGDRDWNQPARDMPLDKGFDYFFGIPASLNYGVLAWFEGRHAVVPPLLFTAKKKNERHIDYRIMPPYQPTAAETKAVLGKNGMEVASDFIDNQCLTRFTDKAIQWMSSKTEDALAGKPFLLYLPLTSPHYPVCPLPDFHGQGDCGGYGEFVIETDHHVGRILKFLNTAGLEDNTIVIYTSDNGPEKSWQQRIEKFGHDSRGGFRGGKREIYEGGHRVPFIVRWPKGIESPGRSFDGLVGQIDVLATIAKIVDAQLPDSAGEDSDSFASILKDPETQWQRRPLINHGSSGRFAITNQNWKLIMAHKRRTAELYDLNSDPQESKNLLTEQPVKVEELTAMITKIVSNGRSTAGKPQPNDTGHWQDLTWMNLDSTDQ